MWLLVRIPVALILLSIVWVTALKWMPVWYTPLMLKRSVEYREDAKFSTHKDWVPIEEISPNMIKAVIASEDNKFAEHRGFDFEEIRKMLGEHSSKGKRLRGCSTISQQTAKNVFTWCSDSWTRKVIEAYYTVLIEHIWGKERIMEVYLNVAEMGRGIYGVEAASQRYYGKAARVLTLSESAALAACLPSPLRRTPSYIMSKQSSRQHDIMSLTHKIAYPEWVK